MRPVSNKLGFLVHDVSRMRRTFYDQTMKPVGITRSQWWALGNISRHADSGMIQTELARILETGKVTVGRLVDRLEDSGLVYRETDAQDRRVRRIHITAKGYDVLDQVHHVGEELDALVHEDISAEELAAATDVLARMKHNLRAALRNPPPISPVATGKKSIRKRNPFKAGNARSL
jgi:MarR family transcriptional regulator for hemolysin